MLRAVGAAAAASAAAAGAVPPEGRAVVRAGTMRLKVSSVGPAPGVVDNPLPAFWWQNLGVEGSMYSYKGPYEADGVPPLPPAKEGPESWGDRSDPELNRQCDADGCCRGAPCAMRYHLTLLPWTRQDMWGCEREERDIPVIEVENDVLKAIITPQYGGKVWSVYHKGLKREFFMRNPAMQPADYSMRKAWTSGGVEWNWSPGFCGHSPFTLSPVYAATVPTERGDVLRVWEFDRTNATVWQVDMLFEGGTMWVHPRVTNPSATHDLNGYWWTNVAKTITVSGRERVLMPAKYDYRGVPWPRGHYYLPQDGVGQNWPATDGGEQSFAGLDFGADYSFVGNLPTGHDFFMRLCDNATTAPLWGAPVPGHCRVVPRRDPAMPYIALAQADGSVVIHAHRGEGTKFFFHQRTTGANFIQRFMAGATPATANGSAPPDEDGVGLYLEAQTGVAPSQSMVFPLPKDSSVEWTEWFHAFQADPKEVHAPDYAEALGAVEGWLRSDAGVAPDRITEMERFFAAHSADPVRPENVLATGLPWGGLQEALAGRALAPGVWFAAPNRSAAAGPAAAAAVAPWAELLDAGGFSAATLSRLPGSFQVSAEWYARLQRSARAGAASWLHHLFLGTVELEWSRTARAAASFARSHALRPNPHSARNLALLAPNASAAWAWYMEAWAAVQPSDGSAAGGWAADDPLRPTVADSLAREICEFARAAGMPAELAAFLRGVPEAQRASEAVQYATASLAMDAGDWRAAMRAVGGNCWPTFVGSGHLGLLTALWQRAAYARYADDEQVPVAALTPRQGQLARHRYPPPRNIGGTGRVA